jgi:co-chaperonin GroES (HSP10)
VATNVEMFSDMVLIAPTNPHERRTEGGILLPATVGKKCLHGEVLAVGPGRPPHGSATPAPMRSRVGDHVYYDDQALTEIELVPGSVYHVVPEGLILGRIVREGMPNFRSPKASARPDAHPGQW